MELNDLTQEIIGCAIEIHKELGPGMLESTYHDCMFYLLKQKGLEVEREKPMPIMFKELKIDKGYRLDLLVENKVVVELKCIESFKEVHFAQILTYMKLGKFPLGLLLNFNDVLMTQGIKRLILKTNHSYDIK